MAIHIALAGNPNCGKTTMFNALTGANQYVGNWPGVTVEKKTGKLKEGKTGEEVNVTDLPGIYSLSPYTLEEVVSRDFILKEKPDVIVDLVDATNIERNLYLATQLLETGIPVVIALNMADLMRKNNIKIDVKTLSKRLGCPIVETSALKKIGLNEVVETAIRQAKASKAPEVQAIFDNWVETRVEQIESELPTGIPEGEKRWYAIKLLEQDNKVLEQFGLEKDNRYSNYTKDLEKEYDDDAESVITDQRYQYIQKLIEDTVKKPAAKMSVSDRIDSIVTNRILGIPIFVLVMWGVYYVSVTTLGTFVTDWTNDTFVGAVQGWAGGLLEMAGASDLIMSLVVDGIIGGVGAVLGFVPQMAILFLFLSILEDCGYMVRIAFVMDRVFRHFGLSGKSFIPLLISSGCGIPGIMASKTIEQDNDRRLTIMTATFVPCGAKLPVIALMGGVMAGHLSGSAAIGGMMAPLMYFLGIGAVLISAIMLKKTKPFSGKPAPFVMELPAYHVPSVKTVLLHVWERLKGFIIKAGTILFLACVVMWALSTFGFENGAFGLVEDSSASLLSVIGGAIAIVFRPLGFGEWQPVAASISGFTAKEAIVSTMGVLANVSEELSEDPDAVAMAIQTWFPSAIAAFSFLVFNLLDSPCLAAIATMAQQFQSRKWFWFAILYQNIFAYVVALCIYQLGGLAAGVVAFNVWTVIALICLALMLYMLFRPDPYKAQKTYSRSSVEAAA
ncbi:ferrous iron transport protein B [Clostridium transplantifaecale]|uniref:ferrous iron transport protein B n=1 Tax=Clostridium transplantifaecale TaxID=2479838 RepID=UPI000F63F0CE|nr:ferrous iron transport protein B [Clostridium transplantifaecale]